MSSVAKVKFTDYDSNVTKALDEIGADPQYESVLSHYPAERGNSTSVVESAILSRLS